MNRLLLLGMLLLAGAAVSSQESAPVMSELDTYKLRAMVAELETLQAQIELAQRALLKGQDEINAYLKSLAKPGYVLQRAPDKSWSYVPAPVNQSPQKPQP